MVEEVMSDKAMSWLWKGTKAMFYLVSPQDLALGPEDPAPMYFLDYGKKDSYHKKSSSPHLNHLSFAPMTQGSQCSS
jgi:hypothetical protein